jgi:arylsulfatase
LHNNTWVVTRALEFLRRRDPTRPFFLNLSFVRPHPPIDPPQVFYDEYRERAIPPIPVGDWAKENDRPPRDINDWCGHLPLAWIERARRGYYAQIAHIDSQIGRLIMSMRLLRPGPTWIVFTSDHGEMLGDHYLFRKTYAYEGSAHTPLFICPPSGSVIQSAVHSSDAPVSQEDLMPTMLEMAGVPVPPTVEGRSLLPLLNAASLSAGWREYVHGEHAGFYASGQGMQYLTDGKEKYIWFTQSGREQFFNLKDDPHELHDLARDPKHQAHIAGWRQRMIQELAPRVQDGLSDGQCLIPGKSLPAVRADIISS